MIFETVSFHIVKPCNMGCKFCYATFDDMSGVKMLPLEEAKVIVDKLNDGGVQKITFAGGEPKLYPHLWEIVAHAKMLGMTTSVITNGSLWSFQDLIDYQGILDWFGLSVDSLNEETNVKIGRTSKMMIDYYDFVDNVNMLGYRLKINTVVNHYNWEENMLPFIHHCMPDRWKIFQTLRVQGQNDKQFDEIKCTTEQFQHFVKNNDYRNMVPENNEDMTGSYLLVDPTGRLFENSKGQHTYSDPLQDNSLSHCLEQIELNRYRFIKRGGIYEWEKPS